MALGLVSAGAGLVGATIGGCHVFPRFLDRVIKGKFVHNGLAKTGFAVRAL